MDKQKEKTIATIQDYQRTFSGKAGERVLWDLMKFGHVLDSTFLPGCPEETFMREGERNTVLRILTMLKYDPAELQKRLEEGEAYDAAGES